jgi:hypothetical protein
VVVAMRLKMVVVMSMKMMVRLEKEFVAKGWWR